MRRACSALALVLLAGCGDTPLAEALRARPEALPVVQRVPGPALIVQGGRQPVTFVAVQATGARRLWRADGGLAMATDGARIVATAGLGQMLVATRLDGADPLEDPAALLGRQATSRRVVDLQGAARDPASMRFGVALECRLEGRQDGAFVVVSERCAGGGIGFTNRFWAPVEGGAVVRSEQWVGEGVPMLSVEHVQ